MRAREAKLHFSRFEFKYVLPARVREQVEAELGHFVELDPYAANAAAAGPAGAVRPGHYFVRSLYFDDPVFGCFRDKVDGVHTRTRFRIRTYARDAGQAAPWFLEIKGRYNNLVFKHRTPVAGRFDPHVRGDDLVHAVLAHTAPGTVRTNFEFDLYRRQLRPVVLVDYERRPYVSRFDPDFRLTFDWGLCAAADDAVFPARRPNLRRLLPGYTVMEVKFRHHVPAWFHRIIQAYELRRVSISKICSGTEALGLQLDPN